MNPERWHRIEEIFNSALEVEPDQRDAYLERECAGDESLREEVKRLLQNRSEAEGFIEAPAIEDAVRAFAVEGAEDKPESPGVDSAGSAVEGSVPSRLEELPFNPHKQAPWWIYIVAAIFFICAGVRYYFCLNHPSGDLGISADAVRNERGLQIAWKLTAVVPDSAAARAGLEPGDLVYLPDLDGLLPVPGRKNSGPQYWKTGRSYRLHTVRNGENRTVSLILRQDRLTNWFTGPNYRPALMSIFISLLELILAAIIVFRRPYDIAARWGALFLGNVAICILYAIGMSVGYYGYLQSLPRVFGWIAVLLPGICMGSAFCVGITFVAIFPRTLFRKRFVWLLLWLPGLLGVSIYIFADNPPLYSFPQWQPGWYRGLAYLLGFAGWCAIPAILIVNYLKLHGPNERRRIRAILVGMAVTVAAYVPIVGHIILPASPFLNRLLGYPYVVLFVLCFLGCALPISIAYAILRHRVFDLAVMIRLGLRYAATRGILLSLVPAVGLALAGDLFVHRRQPLGDILNQRGLIYAAFAGGGFLLHIRRRAWLTMVDRHFFRERYDSHRILLNVIEEIRKARTLEKVAPNIILRIETALHSEFVSLLLLQSRETECRIIATGENTPPPVPANSRFLELIRVLTRPTEISPDMDGWPWPQLPDSEKQYLRRSRLDFLFPISLDEGQTVALLLMGPKKSEEPYSQEDCELLQGIASSLAFLFEQTAAGAHISQGFEECPECGTCYDSGSDKCKKEGAMLTPLSFPRLLSNRYLFERRLGRGGMGIVYMALDTQLDRQVAIKLVHPDLIGSEEAAARFRQEAKAAASLTHPNVVTVHDYGVAADRRAYLVMELLHGSTLRQLLRKQGKLAAPRAVAILRGVCSAVDAAHAHRLIHRDLKPENIFLTNSEGAEAAKILDFGVVKQIAPNEGIRADHETNPGILLGTLSYMSPEELQGGKAAESWDVWALSVVAYEMLTGTHPFEGSGLPGIMDAVRAGQFTPVNKHLADAPAALQDFFAAAFSPCSESRPASAHQLFSGFARSLGE